MGKQFKKNSGPKNRAACGNRPMTRFNVKGQQFAIAETDAAGIAEFLKARGYQSGAVVSWRGGKYKLTRDAVFGDWTLARMREVVYA